MTSPTPEEEEAHLKELRERGVEYTNVNSEQLDDRKKGTDFQGNLTEFDLTFEWVWEDAESKILIEKSTGESFSGWIYIKDDRLDERTYSNQEQKIKFKNGVIQFIDSLTDS